MEKRYKRPIRKLYSPGWLDRTSCPIPPGSIVYVTGSWGPFRAIETVETPPIRGTCGKGSLVAVPMVPRGGSTLCLAF